MIILIFLISIHISLVSLSMRVLICPYKLLIWPQCSIQFMQELQESVWVSLSWDYTHRVLFMSICCRSSMI